jgi:hypothetical protein
MGRTITVSLAVLLTIGRIGLVHSETAKENGVEAAWKACQECRQNYDTYRVTAATKLAQGDVAAATKAATHEFSHMFDGMNIRFTSTGNFVTAEVMFGSKVHQRTDLTLSQFNELLVGWEGKYDNVLEKSIPVVVRQISDSLGKPIEQQSAIQLPAQRRPMPKPQQAGVPAGQAKAATSFPPQAYQSSPSELQPAAQEQQQRSGGGREWRLDDDATGYSPQLEARANAIFGKGNIGNEPARQQWMADQEQRAIENEINRSKALFYPVGGR